MAPIAQEELEKHAVREDLIELVKMYLFREYEEKEKMLKEPAVLRQIERGVYLNVIDTLWMEHIDNMQHLREAVSIRGYGQRDPLISYKEEGYEAFAKMMNDIQSNTVGTIFKIDLKKQLPEQFLQLGSNEPAQLRTNEAQIEEVLSGGHKGHASSINASTPMDTGNHVIVKTTSEPQKNQPEVGRNDPCPCGSGKKYKKCHGANA